MFILTYGQPSFKYFLVSKSQVVNIQININKKGLIHKQKRQSSLIS